MDGWNLRQISDLLISMAVVLVQPSPRLAASRRRLRNLMLVCKDWRRVIETVDWDEHRMDRLIVVYGAGNDADSKECRQLWGFNGIEWWHLTTCPCYHETADILIWRGRVMVVGGWVNGRLTSRIDVWDGESWSRTDMPVERGSFRVCLPADHHTDDHIFLLPGRTDSRGWIDDHVIKVHIGPKLRMREVGTQPAPSVKGYQLVEFDGRKLLVGGWNSTQYASDWVLQFNTTDGTLPSRPITNLPKAQDWCAAHCVVTDGKEELWVIGLTDDGEGTCVHAFDGMRWREASAPPSKKVSVPAFFTLQNVTYAVGAFSEAVGFRWQPKDGLWGRIPVPHHFISATDSSGDFVTAISL